jgi:hypothetical protein
MATKHPEEAMRGRMLRNVNDGELWPWTAALDALEHMELVPLEEKKEPIKIEPIDVKEDIKEEPVESIDVPEMVITPKAYKVGK